MFGIIVLQFVSPLLGNSMVELMDTSSKRAYATCIMSQVCYSKSPCPHGRPLLTCASTGDTQTLKGRSGSVSVGSLGPSAHKVLFEPSEHLWWVWGLILNMISPFLLSCGFSFALEHGAFTPWNTIQQWKEKSFRYTQHLAVSQQNYTE